MKKYTITAEINVPYQKTYEIEAKSLKSATRAIQKEMKKELVRIPKTSWFGFGGYIEVEGKWEGFSPCYDQSYKKDMKFIMVGFSGENP
jgi:hypothetical protein